jgi:cbb3-type cytochrome oxidase subunit 3
VRDLAYDFFQRSPVMAAPLFAMLLFIAVFALVLVRVLRARRDEMDRAAALALEEESNDVEA